MDPTRYLEALRNPAAPGPWHPPQDVASAMHRALLAPEPYLRPAPPLPPPNRAAWVDYALHGWKAATMGRLGKGQRPSVSKRREAVLEAVEILDAQHLSAHAWCWWAIDLLRRRRPVFVHVMAPTLVRQAAEEAAEAMAWLRHPPSEFSPEGLLLVERQARARQLLARHRPGSLERLAQVLAAADLGGRERKRLHEAHTAWRDERTRRDAIAVERGVWIWG